MNAFARFRCPGCAYLYDERLGNPREGFPPGTRWQDVPDDWACPDCAVRQKADFLQVADGKSEGAVN